MRPSIQPLGDSAVLIHLRDADDAEICRSIRRLTDVLVDMCKAESPRSFVAVVPAFTSITVHFCLRLTSFQEAAKRIERAMEKMQWNDPRTHNLIEIPVCFDASCGPDLANVASTHSLEPDELISRFCSAEYSVRMIGFSPGFPYLSGLPTELATPRRSTPRIKVPQGSVAIGGSQAGIYSQETPGGWNIIGRTPRRLFCAESARPCLLTAGDQVRFVRIQMEEFQTRQDEQ